jgi:RNA polymerase sigma-70 factor (ECF subfamily)
MGNWGKIEMQCEAQLKDIASGNKQAFDTLYGTWRRPMVGYATGLLAGDRSAAEDIVNEAFFAIWAQAGNFNASGSAEGWMRRIVRNKAIDWIRKQRDVPMSDNIERSAKASQIDESPSPFDHATEAAAAGYLRDALKRLSLDQREAIWLCYFEERSIADIAQIANCPQNTVKTRLFNARRILRDSGLLEMR